MGNTSQNIRRAFIQLEQECEEEVFKIKRDLINMISKDLSKYSPLPSTAPYSMGDFAINTYIEIGKRNMVVSYLPYNYNDIQAKEVTDQAAWYNYQTIRNNAINDLKSRPMDTVYIFNTMAHNILVEHLGWNFTPVDIVPDIIEGPGPVGPITVWPYANRPAYKPFSLAYVHAKSKLPALIKFHNKLR